MHDHDQDYEVAEPAVAPDENGDAERSPSARFWRKASTAEDAAGQDGLTGHDRTSGHESPEGDTAAYGQAGPGAETAPAAETDPADEDPFDDDVIVVAEVIDADPASADLDSGEPDTADLASADLASADLASADLASADLDSADLDSADLDSAEPDTADLDIAADEAQRSGEPIAMPTAAETTVDSENAGDLEHAGDSENAGDLEHAGDPLNAGDLLDAGDPDGTGLSKTPATAYDREVTPEPVQDAPDAVDDVPGQPFDSQAWREIQASFVDDPRGAVQMAADAADSALSTLVTALRNQQASLDPAASKDTEQLRAALQEYRKFCQAISEVARRLPQPAASR